MKPRPRWLVLSGALVWLLIAYPSRAQQAPQQDPAKVSGAPAGRRRALELLAEAEAALEAGQTARAVTLAREAQQHYPESRAIAGFLASLQAESGLAKSGGSTANRAKAHLAAALTRAQVLMNQRRYTEAVDLLNGIVEAGQKLPGNADIALYRELADKQLHEYRAGVQAGKIRPSADVPPPRPAEPAAGETAAGEDAKRSASTPRGFVPAPANAYRLVRVTREQAPAWYTRLKTALRRPMSVDYRAMPLGLVLEDIRRAAGVPVIVDAPVQAAKTTMTAQIDLRVSTVPAETVLSLATQVAGCEYVLLEKGVIITTSDKAGDYIRNLPDAVANQWAQARHLFPDLYLEAMTTRPLPEAKPSPQAAEEVPEVPAYLRSGRELVADIEQLLR
jgi:hypothetical protein